MILVLLLATEFLNSIQGNYVCPPAPPFDKSCMWIRIRPGCSTDQDCTEPGTKCCNSKCNVLQCVESVQGVVKDGMCPPPPNVILDFCMTAKISSNCDGNDANCPGQKKCCPTPCGSQNCRDPINNFVCPPYGKDIVCIDFDQQCTSNYDCKDGNICCTVECGTACKTPYRPPYDDPKCQPVGCKMHCEYGFVKDENGCEICRCIENPKCQPVTCLMFCEYGFAKDENGCEICSCKQKTCPSLDEHCNFIPPGDCTKENFLIIDGGVKCPLCPSIIPCNKDCLLPVQPGPCKGAFKRYYYDMETNACIEFIYGGCQGNNNNFNSLQECEDKCSTNPTAAPVVKPGSCPNNNGEHPVCRPGIIPNECSDDRGCPGERKCCRVACLQVCVDPEPVCPPVCAIFCEFGNVVDSNGCPTCQCRDKPCPPDPPCPVPPLVPPGECPRRCRFIYEDIDGVRCKVRCELGPAGRKGPPCLPNNCIQGPTDSHPPPLPACEKGTPLSNLLCGLGGQTCPDGYYCNINVCCQIPCKNGSPHPTLTCGQVTGSNNCPPGYSCLAHPADAYFACCPDESSAMKYGSCPPLKPDTAGICLELCSGDESCPGKEKCCSNGCGHVCTNPIGEHICAIIRCPVSCKYGYELDNYGCQTCNCTRDPCPKPVCMRPPEGSCTEATYVIYNGIKCMSCPKIVECKPQPCPLPNCVPPPPLSCTEPDFRIFNGVNCPWCPRIVPCKPDCDAGMPLPNINCGLRPDRQDCPAGFFCNVDAIDRFAVCCPECTRGKPLPNVLCDDVNRKCPSDYYCKKIHGICCPTPCLSPPCPPPPQGACIEPQYTIIDGVKCPACYKIVPCKDKVCPAVPADSRCYKYTRECKDDSSCTDGRKCCRQGCSYVCVNPV